MINWIQRFVYHLANAVPLMLMTALVWFLEYETWLFPIILLTIATTIAILFAVFFSYWKYNCSIKNINVTSISSKDSWVVAYFFSYLLPFANMIMSDFHTVMLMVVILMLGLVIVPSFMAMPNILLYLFGYRFYDTPSAPLM